MSESFKSNVESLEKLLLPKELFTLQVQFAIEVARQTGATLSETLLKYTSAHARLFHHPTKGVAEEWGGFVENLSDNPESIADSIYDSYLAKEEAEQDKSIEGMETFGCFSQQYKETRNMFVLHFGNHDPDGNLGRDRFDVRQEDLQKLTESIASQQHKEAQVQMTSWLLSIDAFNRLLPQEFVEAIQDVELDAAQDNGLWGQFLDKDGGVKTELAEQLLKNIRSGELSPTDCFPCKLKTAKVPQEIFFAKYL